MSILLQCNVLLRNLESWHSCRFRLIHNTLSQTKCKLPEENIGNVPTKCYMFTFQIISTMIMTS